MRSVVTTLGSARSPQASASPCEELGQRLCSQIWACAPRTPPRATAQDVCACVCVTVCGICTQVSSVHVCMCGVCMHVHMVRVAYACECCASVCIPVGGARACTEPCMWAQTPRTPDREASKQTGKSMSLKHTARVQVHLCRHPCARLSI